MKKSVQADMIQTSLFDLLADGGRKRLDELSSDEWLAVIQSAQAQYEEKKAEEQKRKHDEHMKEQKRKHDEHVEAVTCMDLPADWNNLFACDERVAGVHAESIADGLILSLLNLGVVDIPYIAQVSGYSCSDVIAALKGAIYQNPDRWNECFYEGWETAEEYLSGNLMRKHKAAKVANACYNGYFADNLKAIETALPTPISGDEIYVTLGAPWVPPDVIDDFIEHLLGELYTCMEDQKTYKRYREVWPVTYEPITGTWDIPLKTRYGNSVKASKTYGTARLSALHIIEKSLNMKTLQVFDKVHSASAASGEKRAVNQEETMAAQEKQSRIIKEFQAWLWADSHRKERLETVYNDRFGFVRQRQFDGSFLTFPTLSPEVSLFPYQKNAVARILFTPNTLLAHEVGAGKTYVMIAAGMELRRMGISRKNMYVVPNNIVGQWESIFRRMYPQAKLLVVSPQSFTPQKREGVLKTLCDQEFDAVIIAYSCFELIPLSKRYYEKEIDMQLKQIAEALSRKNRHPRLKNRKEALKKKLFDIQTALQDNIPATCFDDLGINTLFVDEAHNFKNISIDTKIDKLPGIRSHGSARGDQMMDKVKCVQRANNGRGVVFATGTPITNSVTDIFTMQTYLQGGELGFLELDHFDNWAANFAEKVTEFEIDVDTNGYRLATRFSRFHNLPELSNLLAQIADFHAVDRSNDLPEFGGYEDKVIAQTPELVAFLKDISARAEEIRSGAVARTTDNMLKLTTDGRKAALDMRLTDGRLPFTSDSKIFRCAENVLAIYRETAARRATQLVFCDSATPKAGFNLYDELKNLLVYYGVPENEVAFVHTYHTEKQREQLFAKMNSGEIRVLIGSTFKLGMGVNVQQKLIAVHHLDVPWRPADMIQREGRILRQGNEHERVRIFRYITDGSFDAYSWQLLESKQRFICQLLSGSLAERSAEDVDELVLNYAEIKALAIGNPLIKERVETANALKHACVLQRKLTETNAAMRQELLEMPGERARIEALIHKATVDIARYQANRQDIRKMPNHRQLGADILKALSGNVMQRESRVMFQYQGFDLVLPAGMLQEKPAVWIEGEGRYYAEMGDSDIGCITRIDNKLNNLPAFIEAQQQALQKLAERRADIERELEKDQSYSADITRLRKKLEKIDKKLGVDKA